MSIQHDDLVNPFGMRVNRMNMQLAKTLGQRALLQRRNSLIAQKHHLMAQHRMVKLFKLIIA